MSMMNHASSNFLLLGQAPSDREQLESLKVRCFSSGPVFGNQGDLKKAVPLFSVVSVFSVTCSLSCEAFGARLQVWACTFRSMGDPAWLTVRPYKVARRLARVGNQQRTCIHTAIALLAGVLSPLLTSLHRTLSFSAPTTG